jgi:putative ABC transport system permease protein
MTGAMSIAADVGYAGRVLRRTPMFAVPAIVSLAVGIAVNTTVFSVVNALLFRPLAAATSDTLVRIGRSMNGDGSFRSVSYDEFSVLQRHAVSFADMVGSQITSIVFGGADGAEFVSAEIVTPNYFRALGPPPIGRGFEEPAAVDTAVISERFWRRRFGADPSAVGRRVSINNRAFTVVGVAPRDFTGAFPGVATDVWLPFVRPGAAAAGDPRAEEPVGMVIGVLNREASIAAARAELQALSQRMRELDVRRDRARGFVAADTRGIHPGIGRRIRPFVLAMMGIVVVVLLVACANVAGLLITRANARRAELALRLGLGASRGRVIQQLLIESAVLAGIGAAFGCLLAFWAVRWINALTLVPGPTGTPAYLDLEIDGRVLAFTAALSTLTTLACGLLPAIQGARVDPIAALKGSPSSAGRGPSRMRSALVVVQVAVAVVLTIGAVLLLRSVGNSARVEVGFDPDGVVVAGFNLQAAGYDRARAARFFDELLPNARRLPGVERASLADFVPMAGRGGSVTVRNPHAPDPAGDRLQVAFNRVSDDYFATVGQPLVHGRDFSADEPPGAPPGAIVNETMAARLWPGQEAIGKRIRVIGESGDAGTERHVVGVARDAKYGSFNDEAGSFLFLPAREGLGRTQTLHIRTASSPAVVISQLNALLHTMDPGVVPQSTQTMREAMSAALVPAEIARVVLGVAAVVALLLATGGLYGLVCYALVQRLKEIGIRVALGATREHVFRLIVGGTIRLAAIGITIGIAIAAGLMRLLSSLLIGLTALDPLTFAGVAILMAAVTLVAGSTAARKGFRVDPIDVLKYE